MGVTDLLRDLDDRLRPPLRRASARLRRAPNRLRLLAGAALTALVVAAVWAAEPDDGAKPSARDVVRVGVVEGQSVPGYLRSSRAELGTLLRTPPPGSSAVTETYALVTLSTYLRPDQAAAVLGGVAVAEVYARVPIADVQTQVVRIPAYRVPDDVVAGMLAVSQRRDREEAEYRHLGAALPHSGAAAQRLRRAYDSAAQVATVEAGAYRSGCSCVFAAVVRAAPAALGQLGNRPDVRVVDPAPEVRRLDRAEFRPPLPEEQGVVPKAPSPASVPAPQSAAGQLSGTPASLPPALASMATIVTSASSTDPGVGPWPSARAAGTGTDVPSALPPGRSAAVPSLAVGASRGAHGR